MSALVNNQVPAFNTAEQLAAYVGLLLARVNPTVQFLETENTSIKACQISVGRAADGKELLIVRVAIPLTSTWESNNTQPLWQLVAPISDTAVPSSYKVA